MFGSRTCKRHTNRKAWRSHIGYFALIVVVVIYGINMADSAAAGELPRLKNLDLIFLLDVSHSLTEEEFIAFKNFMIRLVDAFKSHGTRLQIGLITFGIGTKTVIDFDNNYCVNEVKDIMNKLDLPSEFGTNAHLGLYVARKQLKSATYGTCCEIPKAIVVLTDGFPSYEKETLTEARMAAEEGIRLFVVGYGEEKFAINLPKFFTDRDNSRVFHAEKAGHLTGVVKNMMFKILADVGRSKQASEEKVTGISQNDYERIWTL